ncbi:MAG TPA: saccharopine dehydrogenase NADP-binding domain-containing protein [bacterium]
MATILILGGYGATGRALARHLLRESDVHLVIAGRRLEKSRRFAEALGTEFGRQRLAAIAADAADPATLRPALAGVEVLVVTSPTTHFAENVARAALETGVDYLDVQLSAQKLKVLQSLASEIARAGRCFITEAGYHPGLPAAMVRYAASHLDRLDRALTAGYLSIGRGLAFSEAVDELMEVFRRYDARVFRSGQWIPPGRDYARRVDFRGEIGVRTCYPMFFEELRPLPDLYPSLKELGFYISGTHWFTDWVITPIAIGALKLAPRHALRPTGRLVWWAMQAFARPPFQVTLLVEAIGLKDGQPTRVTATVSHPDGYEITAIPVAACLLQYLDGTARRPGLWMMGHLVDPLRLFKDMERMGVSTTTIIRPSAGSA